MIRVYLVLQEFEDGRVMFRRVSPDIDGVPPGGAFQKQSLDAFRWFLEQAWNFPEFPIWPFELPLDSIEFIPPFEVIA